MKEIKGNLNKVIYHIHGLEDSISMLPLPKLFYWFKAISTKIQSKFFVGTDSLILKFIWKRKDYANS